MPADASIYNAFAVKPKSVAEYDQEYAAADDAKANRVFNALKLQTAQQEFGDQQGYRNLLSTLPAGSDQKAVIDKLSASGNPVAIARAQAMQKAQLESAKTQSEIGKNNAATAASSFDLQRKKIDHGVSSLVSASTPDAARQAVLNGVKDGIWDQAEADRHLAAIPQDPAQYQQWRQQTLLGALSTKDQFDAQHKEREYQLKAQNEIVGPDGRVNQTLLDAKKSISKAGRSNVNVKVDAKLGEGLANQVGPMMKDSAGAAEGAARQIDAANRILSALDGNKLFAGPGAETRLTVAQISDTLGIGGNTNAEKIANTRQALQGLSQLTLQGRQQMRGQGAITESESKLAERATSGDISMTPAEIRQLANAAKRAANYMQSEHQRKLNVMRQNPALAGMVPFYDVASVPVTGNPSGSSTVLRFDAQGNLVK